MRRYLVVSSLVMGCVFVASSAGLPADFCLVRRIFGIPCPGCGVTTSIAALLRGDLAASMRANVAGPVVAAVALLHLVSLAAPGTARVLRASDRVLLISLAAAWLGNVLIVD